MKRHFVLLIISLSLIWFSASSLLKQGNLTRLVSAQTVNQPRPQPRRRPAPLDGQFSVYVRDVRQIFKQQQFAEIDEQARKARDGKERMPGGYWKLNAIYTAVSNPEGERQAPDGEWEDQLTKLRAWVQAQPKSITARVALADSLMDYAWKARGTGYADTVTEIGGRLFEKRLTEAERVLRDAGNLKEKCPHWYVLMMQVAQLRGSLDQLDELFRKAVKSEPTYYYFYRVKSINLLPRWHGAPGDWEKFAEESAQEIGGYDGDVIFFLIYTHMYQYHDVTFMNEHHQAWPRLLAGFRALEKLYGVSPQRLNEACFFAISVGDIHTANELFDRIGDQSDLSVWRSKQTFEMFRQSAQSRRAEPRQNLPTTTKDP
jgi:hypothetical protein